MCRDPSSEEGSDCKGETSEHETKLNTVKDHLNVKKDDFTDPEVEEKCTEVVIKEEESEAVAETITEDTETTPAVLTMKSLWIFNLKRTS